MKSFSSFLSEVVYKGNIGIAEVFQFFDKAQKTDPDLVKKVRELIYDPKKKDTQKAWKLIQDFLKVSLHGDEFH